MPPDAESVYETAVPSGSVTVPVNVGLASGALRARSLVRFVTCDSVILPVRFAEVVALVALPDRDAVTVLNVGLLVVLRD